LRSILNTQPADERDLYDINLEGGNPDYELLIRSRIGSTRTINNVIQDEFLPSYQTDPIKIMHLNVRHLDETVILTSDSMYRSVKDRFPFKVTQFNLLKTCNSMEGNYPQVRRIVVVSGDSIADFLVYFNLLNLSDGIVWIPSVLLTHKYNYILHRITDEIRRWANDHDVYEAREVCLTSCSKSEEELRSLMELIKREPADPYARKSESKFVISRPLNTRELFCYRSFEVEPRPNITLLQFVDNRATSLLELPKPAVIGEPAGFGQWMVEMNILGVGEPYKEDGYILPPVEGLGDHLMAEDDEHYLDQEVRISGRSFIVKCPRNGFLLPGQMIGELQMQARITLLPSKEIFGIIFRKNDYDIEISDKGNYMNSSIELFGSLDELVNEFKNTSVIQMLNIYLDDSKPAKRKNGVLVNNRVYLKFDDILNVLKNEKYADKKIDQYVSRGIFTKGFILQCERCRQAEWYRLEEIGQSFICVRCNTRQIFTKRHWKEGAEPSIFYKLDEMFYQGYKNNMWVPILTLGYLKRTRSAALPICKKRN